LTHVVFDLNGKKIEKRGHHGQVVMVSTGLESEGQGLKPQRFKVTFDPRLPKNPTKTFPAS